MKMTKRELTKKVARFVTGSSVAYTVANATANNTMADTTHRKVQRYVGSVVVGYMAAEAAETWSDRKVDATFDWFAENFNKN